MTGIREGMETLERCQITTARIAGALAHELNNPLQGVLSLLSAFSHEHAEDPQAQVRVAQIRSGLVRIGKIVESLLVICENLPRSPDRISIGTVADRLVAEFKEHQLRAFLEPFPYRDAMVSCLAPELTRLVAHAFAAESSVPRSLNIRIENVPDYLILTCERPSENHDTAEPWHQLRPEDHVSGLSALIDEIIQLGQGQTEFQFDNTGICGIQIWFRTQMT